MITSYAYWLKKAPSFIYRTAAKLWYDPVFPRHLFIETTASCNLTCSYCPREKLSDHMDFRLFQSIVDEASQYGPRSFSLHLFGESLLYPRIFDACAYIKRKNKSHTILLTTNGTKVNECVDDLVGSGVSQVFWTWRPEAKFTEGTKEKLKRWGKFRVRFINEITPERAYKEYETWPNKESRRLHNYGGEIKLERFKKVQTLLKESTQRWSCYHLWYAPAVAWNGKILICCADPHQKEIIGDVREGTVSEAWQRIERLRQSHLKGEFSGICKNCDVWKEYPKIF